MLSLEKIFEKIVGTQGERDIKRLRPRIERINALEPAIAAMSDEAMRARIAQFRVEVREKLGELPPGLEKPQRWDRRSKAVSYTHLRAHETRHDLVCRLLLE